MTNAHIRKHCAIDSTLGDLRQPAMEQLSLSARAYDRILKVARPMADLGAADRMRPRTCAKPSNTTASTARRFIEKNRRTAAGALSLSS